MHEYCFLLLVRSTHLFGVGTLGLTAVFGSDASLTLKDGFPPQPCTLDVKIVMQSAVISRRYILMYESTAFATFACETYEDPSIISDMISEDRIDYG